MLRTLDQAIADPAASQTQPRELERVTLRLQEAVLDFAQLAEETDPEFTAGEMETWVTRRMLKNGLGITPGSASRILRLLKRKRFIDYDCINRRESRYRLNRVASSLESPLP